VRVNGRFAKKTKEKNRIYKIYCQNNQKGNACHGGSDEKNLKTVLFLCKDLTKKLESDIINMKML